jgi:hypothetical protein
MSIQGQPESKGEKRMLLNWGAAMLGVIVGGLGGAMIFAHSFDNPPVAAMLGAAIGGIVGFTAPTVLRLLTKAQ